MLRMNDHRISPNLAALGLYLSTALMIVYVTVDTFALDNVATSDSARYTAMADGGIDGVIKPFRFRFLVPWLASFVPKMTSDPDRAAVIQFAAFNVVGMTVAAFAIYLIARHYRFSPAMSAIAGLAVLTCYPMLRFGGAPMTDASAYGALALALLLALRRRWVWFAVAMLVGMLAKETTVFGGLLALLAVTTARDRWLVVAASAPGLLAHSAIRWIIIPTDDGYSYGPSDVLDHFIGLLRPAQFMTTTGQIATSFSVLWVFAAVGAWANRNEPVVPQRLLWALPAIAAISVVIGSNYGRVWFLAFPVVVLFALRGVASVRSAGVEVLPQRAVAQHRSRATGK